MIIDSVSCWVSSQWVGGLVVGGLLAGGSLVRRFNKIQEKHVWGSDFA